MTENVEIEMAKQLYKENLYTHLLCVRNLFINYWYKIQLVKLPQNYIDLKLEFLLLGILLEDLENIVYYESNVMIVVIIVH